MNLYTLFIVAVGLSMDAVSVANGMTIHGLWIRHAVSHALCFGFLQAVMPVVGWVAGTNFSGAIAGVDHCGLTESDAMVIGVVAFVLSLAGALTGKKLGHHLGGRMETFGGIVLITIGLKILLDHT